METYLKIGDFSERVNVSKRMLRHYDEMGLLVPHVDELNGYRLYSPAQINEVKVIKILNTMGFTLSEIKDLIQKHMDQDAFVALLTQKQAALRLDIDAKVVHKIVIDQLLRHFEKNHFSDFDVKQLPIESEVLLMQSSPVQLEETLFNTIIELSQFNELIQETFVGKADAYFVTFDIDNFIRVNDLYGFGVGDRVIKSFLRQVYETFLPAIHGEQAIFNRLGGDEIGLFITGMSENELVTYIETAIQRVSHTDYHPIGCQHALTASAGLYKCKTQDTFQSMHLESTKALIKAKEKGKNQWSK